MSECLSFGATGRSVTKRRATVNSESAIKSIKVSSPESLVKAGGVPIARSDRDLIKILKDELKDVKLEDRLCDGPVLVALLDDVVWKSYCELEDNPLELRFLHQESGKLYIIELPNDIHEHYALRILLQLAQACPYVTSLGSKRITQKEADQFILPLPDCPNAVFPANPKDCATVIVEVGLSQGWGGIGGLDMKAQHWFVTQAALEYIVCVRITKDKNTHQVKSLTYKVYDIAACNGVFPLHNPALSFTLGNNHNIVLDAHRVLRIPTNSPLPVGCPAQFDIDLVRIRTHSTAFGL
jgi:hypothetical protein